MALMTLFQIEIRQRFILELYDWLDDSDPAWTMCSYLSHRSKLTEDLHHEVVTSNREYLIQCLDYPGAASHDRLKTFKIFVDAQVVPRLILEFWDRITVIPISTS